MAGKRHHRPLPGLPVVLKARGLRQIDVAEELGLDASAISLKARGKRALSLDEALHIAEFLDCSLYDLLAEPGDLLASELRGVGGRKRTTLRRDVSTCSHIRPRELAWLSKPGARWAAQGTGNKAQGMKDDLQCRQSGHGGRPTGISTAGRDG